MSNTKRIFSIIAILIVIMIATSFNTIINFVTDYKWFQELAYEKVFLTKLLTQIKVFVPVFLIMTLILFVYLTSLKKDYYKKVNVNHSGISEGKIKLLTLIASIFIAFISSITVSGNLWFDILKFVNGENFNFIEPIFNKDISFYIFQLPLFNKIYLLSISFIFTIFIVTIIFYVIMMALRRPTLIEVNSEQEFNLGFRGLNNINLNKIFEIAIKQLTALAVIFFVLLGAGYYLKSFELLYSPRGVVYGASFTDINVVLWRNRAIMILSIISALLIIFASRKRKLKLAVIGPALMIIVSILANVGSILVQNYIVSPDEIAKEKKYIDYNIGYTQKAYGIENIEQKSFPVEYNITKEVLEENADTISNIRINDKRPTKLVYNQKQGIRQYYKFNDVDVDRYTIDGKYTEVYLSPREFDINVFKEDKQSFLNKHLIYTHGYGIAMSPVNKVNSAGLPKMIIENIPPINLVEGFEVTRPEIYFGELTNDYIITNTNVKEFDYPSGNTNEDTVYEGKAGVNLGGINKLLFSYKNRSMKMLLANGIDSSSKIIFNRNIHDRVKKIMPYIEYDPDPYVVLDEGKIYWIMDGYTLSDSYPYSEPINENGVNYIRNSVKIVIDAYNGDTTYYVADKNDPIINTYRNIFPQLFKDLKEMPEGLQSHVRYPQLLFDIQAEIYRVYHMNDPKVFYNKEDEWNIAQEKYEADSQDVESNYLMMSLPDEDKEEFLLSIPYTPKGKPNMTGLLIGRSDGENYGNLVIYKLPKSKNVYGPMQIENRIDSDANISKEFSFWNQQGSKVIRGNLLTIPINNSLLYVEPVYLKAEAAESLPEMKKVIVAYGDKIIMEDTLEEALDKMFGGNKPNVPTKPSQPTTPNVPVNPNQPIDDLSTGELITKANQVFTDAVSAQKNGDWATYGDKLSELESILNKLNSTSIEQ